jgi:hypothetical protein
MLWLFGSESGVEPGDIVDVVCPECGLIRHCVEVIQTSGFSIWFVPITESKKLSGYVCQVCGTHFETPGEVDTDLLLQIAETLAKEGTEAAQIASNNAISSEVRLSQLRVAQDKLAETEQMAELYPMLKLTRLDDYKQQLFDIESDILSPKYNNWDKEILTTEKTPKD